MAYCVYVHEAPDGRCYVGITQDAKQRWGASGKSYKGQQKFWAAIQSIGWDNFKHTIVKDGLTKEEACAEERRLIKQYDSRNNGFNTATGGQAGGTTTYYTHLLQKYISEALRVRPDFENAKILNEHRQDREFCEKWNEAFDAVMKKYGDEFAWGSDVLWKFARIETHMYNYLLLSSALFLGICVEAWRDAGHEEYVAAAIGGKPAPNHEICDFIHRLSVAEDAGDNDTVERIMGEIKAFNAEIERRIERGAK